MININALLKQRHENGDVIQVGIVGAGQMGKGLVKPACSGSGDEGCRNCGSYLAESN